jgi:C4-dicarboxylate transporter, DctQ subunit
MKKLGNFLLTFERTFSYVLVILLTVILFTQIINRYIFSTSFVWLEEIARISFVWLIYFCVASAARENSHIRVGLIDMFVPASWVRILNYIADALVIGFSLIIVWFGIELMLSTIAYGEKTSVTNIPMAVIYAVIPFCFALMVIRIVDYNFRQLTGRSRRRFDDGDKPSKAFGE